MYGFIYKIQNKLNNKVYIGQSKLASLNERLNIKWIGHFPRAFEMNSNQPIHVALRKYGKDAFTYEIIENNIVYDQLDIREKFWINKYNSTSKKYGYNATIGGKEGFAKVLSGTHRKHTEEAKQKMREAALRRPPMPDEVRQKISKTKLGHKMTQEQKLKNSLGHKGQIKSAEWRKHLSESRKGFKMSIEQKKKISEKLKQYYKNKRQSSKKI